LPTRIVEIADDLRPRNEGPGSFTYVREMAPIKEISDAFAAAKA
jgi:hypothetical protein